MEFSKLKTTAYFCTLLIYAVRLGRLVIIHFSVWNACNNVASKASPLKKALVPLKPLFLTFNKYYAFHTAGLMIYPEHSNNSARETQTILRLIVRDTYEMHSLMNDAPDYVTECVFFARHSKSLWRSCFRRDNFVISVMCHRPKNRSRHFYLAQFLPLPKKARSRNVVGAEIEGKQINLFKWSVYFILIALLEQQT